MFLIGIRKIWGENHFVFFKYILGYYSLLNIFTLDYEKFHLCVHCFCPRILSFFYYSVLLLLLLLFYITPCIF